LVKTGKKLVSFGKCRSSLHIYVVILLNRYARSIFCLYFGLLMFPLNAQFGVDTLGIVQYGNTIESSFHSAKDIYQDSINRLVFNSGGNIYRYDGHEFENLGLDTLGSLLSHDPILKIDWYSKDYFFLKGYRNGELVFTIQTKDYFERNITTALTYNDYLFVVTNSGVIQFRREANKFAYLKSYLIDDVELYGIHAFNDSLFINGSKGNYFLDDYKSGEGTFVKYNSSYNKLYIETPDKQILLTEYPSNCNNAIYQAPKSYDQASDLYQLLKNKEYKIGTVYPDSKDGYWFNARYQDEIKAVYYLDKDGAIIKIPIQIEENIGVLQFYEDHEQNIWLGTQGSGLILIYDQAIQIFDKAAGLSSDNVMAIQESQAGLHFITNCGGVTFIDYQNSRSIYRESDCQTTGLVDNEGNIWLSASPAIIKYSDNQLRNSYSKKDGLYSRTVLSLFQDTNGTMWSGTRKAIHRLEADNWQSYIIDSLADFNRASNLVEIDQETILVLFLEGQLFTFNKEKFTPVEAGEERFKYLMKDLESRIWLVGKNHQLYKYQNYQISKIEWPDILSPQISFLQDDREGYLWGLNIANEIFCAKKEDLWNNDPEVSFKILNPDNGLPLINSNAWVQPNTLLMKDGRVVFPNIHGAIMINPKKIQAASGAINHVLEYKANSFIDGQTINLKRGQKYFETSFKPISYNPNHTVELQMNLNDESWKEVRAPDKIVIEDLDYGENNLKFRFKYASGEWNQAQYLVESPKPIFLQWWFILVSMLFLFTLLWAYSNWRNQIIKERNLLLQNKVNQQTKIIKQEKEQLAKILDNQKQLTQELKFVNESKNKLYAQISHEFKSPLQALRSYILTAKNQSLLDNQDLISKNIDVLLNFSTEIMDLSKAESGQMKVRKDHYDLVELIQQEIDLKRALSDSKKIKVNFNYDAINLFVLMDLSLIQKVISNLLSNAIKFSSAGSQIDISIAKQKDKLCVSFTDYGIGIDKTEIEKLTTPYFQASNNFVGGTGIGLSLVDQILKLHDSTLNIVSTLGKGSHFSFDLQYMPSESLKEDYASRMDQTISQQLTNIIDLSKAIVLIVDDSKDVLYFLKKSLTPLYNVISSNNPLITLEYLNDIKPSLIISDQNMPLMSGIRFLKKIRSNKLFDSTPFILLTGSMTKETEVIAIQAGADAFLSKPVEKELILPLVKQFIGRQNKVVAKTKSTIINNLMPAHISDEDDTLMKELDGFLITNIQNSKLKSEDIAEAIGIGEKTLRNRIKAITGHTLKSYLKQYRITKAKELLISSQGTKGEVARAVGFSSLSYFTKVMKAEEKKK